MEGQLKPRRFGLNAGEVPALDQPSYDDPAFLKKYPLLAEFLQRELWTREEDVPWTDRVRQKGTLILFCEEGQFKACLSDKDSEAVAFASKKSFQALLETLEKGLANDSLDWRLTAAGKGKKRK